MAFAQEDKLSTHTAQRIAHAYIVEMLGPDNTSENPVEGNSSGYYGQVRWLTKELAKLCVADSVKNEEDELELRERLGEAWDIVSGIWYVVTPSNAYPQWLTVTDQEQEKRFREVAGLLWQRHDPVKAFSNGYLDPNSINFNRDELQGCIANYLARPYLRHPYVDWVLLDITVTGEICGYGESLKQKFLKGKRDLIGFHHKYHSSKGNFADMRKLDWNEIGTRYFTWLVLMPLAIWFFCFDRFHFEEAGKVATAVYVLGFLLFLTIKAYKIGLRLLRRVTGSIDPYAKPFMLWDTMYKVWPLLAPPIINPRLVREAMNKAAVEGTVWDTVSYSILDRVIEHDASVWLVQEST